MFPHHARGLRPIHVWIVVAVLFGFATSASAGDVTAKIDFDVQSLPKGTIVNSIQGDDGEGGMVGPVGVLGTLPGHPENRALIFDSSLRTGGDTDLGTPNQTFGGPGIGSGGESGQPFQNDQQLFNVLIVAENLVDANNDGLVDSPDDAHVYGMLLEFDFTSIQAPFAPEAVTVHSITTIDAGDATHTAGEVRIYDDANQLIYSIDLIPGGNNGLVTQPLGTFGMGVTGAAKMIVQLNGSSANWIAPSCCTTRPRSLRMAASSAWVRRSASRPGACMPVVR